jgi:hypothetical protein
MLSVIRCGVVVPMCYSEYVYFVPVTG